MEKFQQIIGFIVAVLRALGGVAAELAEAIMTFLSVTGPAGLKVATDVALDVAAKNVTPEQAIVQLQDVAALGAAIGQAVQTIKAEQAAAPAPAA